MLARASILGPVTDPIINFHQTKNCDQLVDERFAIHQAMEFLALVVTHIYRTYSRLKADSDFVGSGVSIAVVPPKLS
jgi:hypothetical protein